MRGKYKQTYTRAGRVKEKASIVYAVVIVGLMLATLAYYLFTNPGKTMWMIAVCFLMVGGIFSIGWLWYSGLDVVKDFFHRRKLNRLLGERTLSEALDQSAYEYGHFQGDNGYRIWRKDDKSGEFVALGLTKKEVHLWIAGSQRKE